MSYLLKIALILGFILFIQTVQAAECSKDANQFCKTCDDDGKTCIECIKGPGPARITPDCECPNRFQNLYMEKFNLYGCVSDFIARNAHLFEEVKKDGENN